MESLSKKESKFFSVTDSSKDITIKKISRQKFEFACHTSLKFLPENCQNANQNAKNLSSVAPVGSKIAPIMLEIKFYII